MNERIKLLAEQSGITLPDDSAYNGHIYRNSIERFAQLIVKDCIDTLLWHGCDDAVPYIEWMAKNKLGVD